MTRKKQTLILGACVGSLLLTPPQDWALDKASETQALPAKASLMARQQAFLPPVAYINGMVAQTHRISLKTNPPGLMLPASSAELTAGRAYQTPDTALESVSLAPVELSPEAKPRVALASSGNGLQSQLRFSEPVKRLDGALPDLNPVAQNDLATLQSLQTQIEQADLERLWQATVERNPVVRFSLEKLALPNTAHAAHSSDFLYKTLNVMVSGAAMGATLFNVGGGYQNMGIMAGSSALQNWINRQNPNTPLAGSLSPTEQIQLAGLVEALKTTLLSNYQRYEHALQAIGEATAVTNQRHQAYQKALKAPAPTADAALKLITAQAYYQALEQETQWRQQAKLARLQLERLAGPEVTGQLALSLSPSVVLASLDLPSQLEAPLTANSVNPQPALQPTVALAQTTPLASKELLASPPARHQGPLSNQLIVPYGVSPKTAP